MRSKLKKIVWNIIYKLSGEINITKVWKHRQNIISKENVILLPWYYVRYHKALQKSGASIPLSTVFISKPVFPHGLYGIFVSAGAKIGKDCVIFQQVTIGSNTLKGSKKLGAPTIGDNCYIGAGAKIIGNIKIGNNVRIGANCVVTEDVPDNCTVVLNKARIIQKKENDNKWLSFNDSKI